MARRRRRGPRGLGALAVALSTATAAAGQIAFAQITPAQAGGATLGQPGLFRGVAAYDYDGDGRDDLLVTGYAGATRLWRNLGGWRFDDRTADLGLDPAASYALATWGDLDGDGDADLVLAGAHGTATRLLRNDGAGRFTDAGEAAELGPAAPNTAAANIADFDGDGRLDLYLANAGAPDQLLRNLGDWRFADETSARAPGDRGVSMGSIAADLDDDGDLDLYLTYDNRRPNRLLRNDGTGHLRDVTATTPLGYAGFGMGVDAGDLDGDGRLDLYVANLYDNLLYASGASPYADFAEVAAAAGVADRGMGWGTVIFDADHDGHADVYVANESPFAVDGTNPPSRLFRNLGDGAFAPADDAATQSPWADFGVATADLDGDGDLDLVLATAGGPGVQLLRNDSPPPGSHFLGVRCAVPGARLVGYAAGRRWLDELHAGSGYASQSSGLLHVGLGAIERLDSLAVEIPGRPRLVFGDVPTGSTYRIDDRDRLVPAGVQGGEGDVARVTPDLSGEVIIGPNPASASITIRLPPGGFSWRLVGPTGSDVASGTQRTVAAPLAIPLAKHPAGAYTLVGYRLGDGAGFTKRLLLR